MAKAEHSTQGGPRTAPPIRRSPLAAGSDTASGSGGAAAAVRSYGARVGKTAPSKAQQSGVHAPVERYAPPPRTMVMAGNEEQAF